MDDVPLLIFDGDCGFCRAWINYWKRLTGERVSYAPFQQAASRFPHIPVERFEQAVHLIQPNGEVSSGAEAVLRTLAVVPGYGWLMWLYTHLRGFAPLAEWAYRVVADHRPFFSRLTLWLFGRRPVPPTHHLVEWLFIRALGIVYFIAFASLGVQIKGLVGAQGILPVGEYLGGVVERFGVLSYWLVPTIFWLNSSDAVLELACAVGAILALVLVAGYAQRSILIVLYVLYLSLVHVGQDFLAFQWDNLLLEAGFLAIFLGGSNVIVGLFRWLLFRLVFMSGAVKLLSGDPTWRSLTALTYHYETQPLPTVFGWYLHHLPAGLHKLSTAVTFVIELGMPFLIFAPRRLRLASGAAILFLQTLIFLTGNYAFFNLLTVALCLFLLDDAAVRRWLPQKLIARNVGRAADGTAARAVRYAAAALLILVSGSQLYRMFGGSLPGPIYVAARLVAPFRVANPYGLFAVMTTSRPEIIVEGSNDGQNWQAYEFKYKPGDLSRPPVWAQPYQPRLDWQMWFAALGSYRGSRWFSNLMLRLLQGSPDVLALLQRNPFPSAPPRYIRALTYDYHFTDLSTQQSSGMWWRRELLGEYFPAESLNGE